MNTRIRVPIITALLLLFPLLAGEAWALSCFGIACDTETCCSGHGQCLSEDYCQCATGYTGSDCSTATFCGACPTLCANGVCLLHGRDTYCTGVDGVCVLLPGWTGVCADVRITATLTPAALDFGKIPVGASGQATSPAAFANPALNTHTAIAAISLGGANPGDFTLGGTCAAGQVVSPGSQCTISVGLTPTAPGSRSATLAVTTTSSAPTLTGSTLTTTTQTTTLTTALSGTGTIAATSLLVDPATPATLYTGMRGAGVYVSTDAGATWTAATTQPVNRAVKALAKGSGTPLFAGTDGGGVFRAADGTTEFAPCASQPADPHILSLTIDAGGRLLAGTEAGVFASSDSCATWTALSSGLP